MRDLIDMRHEIQLLLIILLLTAAEIAWQGQRKQAVGRIALLLFAIHTLSSLLPAPESSLFGGMILNGPIYSLMKSILDMGTLVVLLLSGYWTSENLGATNRHTEWYMLLFSSLFGMYMMVSANHLLVLYIGLELSTLPVAALAAFEAGSRRSAEAGTKLVLTAGFASAFSLLGISFLYAGNGSLFYQDLTGYLSQEPFVLMGLVLFLSGVLFKISLVPFHFWAPDVYEGSPVGIAAFLSVVSKSAAVFVLLLFLTRVAKSSADAWHMILYILAVMTMTIGNLFAIRQMNLKRFLAFSSVAQAGFLMLGFFANPGVASTTVVYFAVVYLFSNLAAFGVVQAIVTHTGKENIDDLNGFYDTNPKLALVMLLALFSLAGIPPLAGFFGKLFLFFAVASAGYYLLLIVAVVNAVISLYYYLLVVRAMFLRSSTEAIRPIRNDGLMRAGLVLCVVFVLAGGMYSTVFDAISRMFGN